MGQVSADAMGRTTEPTTVAARRRARLTGESARVVAPGRARSRAAVVAWCVVLVVSAAGCAGCVPRSAGGGGISGTRVGFTNGGQLLWESDADLARDLDTQVLSGARWLRVPIDFNSVQAYGPGSWNWSFEDRVIGAAVRRGLKVLAMPAYTPAWARASWCSSSMYCPPANPDDFANFVRAAAVRYAPSGVHAWEIWNEPNWAPWWLGAPNAAAYVSVLRPTYLALHAADPSVTVVSGGLAPHGDLSSNPSDPFNPVNYLEAMYAAGARGFFDAVGIHPYPPLPYGPLFGSVNWNTMLQTSMLHDVMNAHGDGWKQLWGTEYGAPTGGTDPKVVTPATQAQYIAQGALYWTSRPYTGPLFIQSVRDMGYADPAQWANFMGVMWQDFTPKPALQTVASMLTH